MQKLYSSIFSVNATTQAASTEGTNNVNVTVITWIKAAILGFFDLHMSFSDVTLIILHGIFGGHLECTLGNLKEGILKMNIFIASPSW